MVTLAAVDRILEVLVGTKVAPKLKTIDRRAICGDINRCLAAYRARLGPPTEEGLADLRAQLKLLKKRSHQAHLQMLGFYGAGPLARLIEEYLAQRPFTSVGYHKRVVKQRLLAGEIGKREQKALDKNVTDVRPLGQLIAVDLTQVWCKHFGTPAGRSPRAKGERASPFIKFVIAVLSEAGLKLLSVDRIADIIKVKGRVKHGTKRKNRKRNVVRPTDYGAPRS
jgi:hypothetical protein